MKKLAVSAAVMIAATAVVPAAHAGAPTITADRYETPSTYEDAMIAYAMSSKKLSEEDAKKYLAEQAEQQKDLEALDKQDGIDFDGAFFNSDNELTVIADDEKTADAARAKGFQVRTDDGQSDLAKEASEIADEFKNSTHVSAIGTDLRDGAVTVTITKDAPESVRDEIKKIVPDAKITMGTQMEAQADVLAGQDMNMPAGGGRYAACSNGFMGKNREGNTVMLTAGHCVTSGHDVLDAHRTHVGTILNTRFKEGSPSQDMGLVDIDSDDSPRGIVDTRGADGYYAVKGMSKNPVGTQLCKSGRTTGWTCGEITGYDTRVNYGKTMVSGLTSTTVCTEQGDSGGAYIGVGNLAQGMTSGGPVGQKCGGFNTRYRNQGVSYIQPVTDAASYYGVTLLTENGDGSDDE